jgi:predicted ArsR family transcriptional regulator
MPNARQKILIYINEKESTTAGELSSIFHVSQANIRHHLSILVQQGSVRVIGERRQSARGRPCQVFASSRLIERNNLTRLSHALLTTLQSGIESDRNNEILLEIANRMSLEFVTGSTNPTQKLYQSVRALNQMNYAAHWEAHSDNPRIMLGHCPYQALIESHPELCKMDAYLLESLLTASVRQIEKLVRNHRDLLECVFIIDHFSA